MSARLRVVPPSAEPPDDRALVARALLTRYVPVEPVISNEMLAFLGADIPELDELERDPRYLIGRLTQALTALLADEVPPLDATAHLLGEAIEDAIKYRMSQCDGRHEDGVCATCETEGLRSARYESLYGQLGLIGELPVSHERPKAVSR